MKELRLDKEWVPSKILTQANKSHQKVCDAKKSELNLGV